MRIAPRDQRVIVKVVARVDRTSELRVAGAEEGVVLTAEVAAVGAAAAQAVAVSGEAGQDHIGRNPWPREAGVVTDRPHAWVVARARVIILHVVAARETGHYGVGVVAVVAVRQGAN